MKLRMGTRGSALALAQSSLVARELETRDKGLAVETVVIKTSGDMSPVGGGKGLFVKEIEEALLDGRVDFAVHSAKDMPAEPAAGLAVAAYPRREDPRDVFIGRDGASWASLKPGARIGTLSLRRKVQLLQAKPGLEFLPLRGNVDTRLKKLEAGEFEGIVLAAAGLKRLGRADVRSEAIPVETLIPAPGQGALALQVRADRKDLLTLIGGLDDAPTRLAVECERAFMAAMGGGCSVPLGAFAAPRGKGVELSVFYSDPEGKKPRRLTESWPDPARREALARELSRRLLA